MCIEYRINIFHYNSKIEERNIICKQQSNKTNSELNQHNISMNHNIQRQCLE